MAGIGTGVGPITINIPNDLGSPGDLKNLISSESGVLLALGENLARYAGQDISQVPAGAFPLGLTLTGTPSWTAGVVSFSLSADAKCTVTIATAGESFPVELEIGSDKATDVQLPPLANSTYINIDFTFDISGSASGSGTTGFGLSVSGKGSAGATFTVSFCQPVPSNTETLEALRRAFSDVVFPTSPDCAIRMVVGSSCRMSFDGTLNWEVDASYGLGDYKLSAPSAALIEQSVAKAWQKLTLPTADIKIGATASLKYAHTDHFGVVITKNAADTAMFYLVRSASSDVNGALGLTVGVKTTPASVSFDPTGIQQTVQNITGNVALANEVATQLSQPANNLEAAATKKLNAWLQDVNGNLALSVAGEHYDNRTSLFSYRVDVSAASTQSWKSLFSRNLVSAANIPGFILLPGSGVTSQLKNSTTIQFNFFNLYNWSNETDYFNTYTAELAADGTIRIVSTTGIEGKLTTKTAVDTMRVFFTTTATADPTGVLKASEIDLNIEISESGDSAGAVAMTKILDMLGGSPELAAAGSAMSLYSHSGTGTLGLTAVLKPSAYGRLAYSPYTGSKPPVSQYADSANWNAIHDAAVNLMGFSFLIGWTYQDWANYSSLTRTGTVGSGGDRHMQTELPVPGSFWARSPDRGPFIAGFFVAAAGGMNFFEDLATLSTASATTNNQLNGVIQHLQSIVKSDLNIDYSKAISAAILVQAVNGGAVDAVDTAETTTSFTTTLTLT